MRRARMSEYACRPVPSSIGIQFGHAQPRLHLLGKDCSPLCWGSPVITLIAVGLRLLLMQTVQQRRERQNRQINEALAYLDRRIQDAGRSFTGDLSVDPTHRRDLPRGPETDSALVASGARARRIRDTVEAALSDLLLLGTEQQVRLAAVAATELASGRPVHTAELVVSLRDFIREVLDLEPVPALARHSAPRSGAAHRGRAGAPRRKKRRRGQGVGRRGWLGRGGRQRRGCRRRRRIRRRRRDGRGRVGSGSGFDDDEHH